MRDGSVNPSPRSSHTSGFLGIEWAWVAALLAFLLGVWIWSVHTSFSPAWDSLIYFSGAAGIAGTKSYAAPFYAGSPAIGLYPPGQSAFLALAYDPNATISDNIIRLRWVMFFPAGLGMLVLYAWLRREAVPRHFAAPFVALVGSSAPWIGFIQQYFSEPWFFAVVWALGLYWSVFYHEPNRLRHWMVTGLMLATASAFRSAGLGLVIGTTIASVVVTRRPACTAAVLIPFTTWTIWWKIKTLGLPGYTDLFRYAIADAEQSGGLAILYYNNALGLLGDPCPVAAVFGLRTRILYALEHHGIWLVAAWKILVWAVEAGVSTAAIAGLLSGSRRHLSWRQIVMIFVAAIYAAQVLASPVDYIYVPRYLLLLLPLCAIGVSRWLSLQKWALHFAASIFLFALVAGNLIDLVIVRKLPTFNAKTVPEVCAWLKAHHPGKVRLACGIDVPVASVVECLGQPVLPDYLGNRSERDLGYPISHRATGYQPAEYVLVRRLGLKSNAPPGAFTEVFRTSDGEFRLLRVSRVYEFEVQKQLYGSGLASGRQRSGR
jgi:hypothetical protein